MSAPEPPLPRMLRLAGVVLVVQGVGVVAAGAAELILALTGHPSNKQVAEFLGVLTIAYGVIVLLVARGIVRGRTWAGTPALMVEFFAVVIGIGQFHTLLPLAIALIVTAAAGFVCLLHSDSRQVLVRDR